MPPLRIQTTRTRIHACPLEIANSPPRLCRVSRPSPLGHPRAATNCKSFGLPLSFSFFAHTLGSTPFSITVSATCHPLATSRLLPPRCTYSICESFTRLFIFPLQVRAMIEMRDSTYTALRTFTRTLPRCAPFPLPPFNHPLPLLTLLVYLPPSLSPPTRFLSPCRSE